MAAQTRQQLHARPTWWAALLITAHLGLTVHKSEQESATYDEVIYPAMGYFYWTNGIPSFAFNPGQPPLIKYWLALPLLNEDVDLESIAGWGKYEQQMGFNFVFRQGIDPEWLLFRARFMSALLSVALAIGVFGLTRKLAGPGPALFALVLYCFDPLVVAHGGLATVDMGGAMLLFFASISLVPAIERGGWKQLLVAGLLMGAALGAKTSAIVLGPVLGIICGVALQRRWRERPTSESTLRSLRRIGRPLAGRVAAIALPGLVVLLLISRQKGLVIGMSGVLIQMRRAVVGEPSYLLGHFGSGWWWYLPVAWLIKTPAPILAATSAGLWVLLRRLRDGSALSRVLVITPGLTAVGYMLSQLDLGVRYWLPVVPFLAVGAGLAYARFARRIWARRLALAGLVWLIGGTLWVHPHELAYANELSGGPEKLWLRLADSNVDWGQSLPDLADAIRQKPLRRLYLSYFGTADPRAYGLRYTTLPPTWFDSEEAQHRNRGPDSDGHEWIAISTNHLIGLFDEKQRAAWGWLRARPMTAFPGYSIALYDITGDAAAHRSLGESLLALDEAALALLPLRRAAELAPNDPEIRSSLERAISSAEPTPPQ